jgi:hypothetical protein
MAIIKPNNNTLSAITALPTGLGGKVLQVQEGEITSTISTTTNSFTDTGLNVNITPSSTSSKILIMILHSGARKQTDTQLTFKLLRDSTDLGQIGNYDSGDTQQFTDTVTGIYLDAPSSTSQLNYKTEYKSANGTIYAGGFKNTITCLEIAG